MQIDQLEKEQVELFKEVLGGLIKKNKTLPSKLFYDEKGSQLFDKICELDEYYPTRTELKIMEDNIESIANIFEENTLLIEYGSGSSLKTKLLLDNIENINGYVPIDISEEHLLTTVENLNLRYSDLQIFPLAADYTKPFKLPNIHKEIEHKITYFPGSTIGNFTPNEAKEFLKIIAETCGENGGLLIGVDLHKDVEILNAAYNDKEGVTAEFNLNILDHINNLFDSNFIVEKFKHHAFYNEEYQRIEMHLISLEDQSVNLGDSIIEFSENETILTEYSHKYTYESFKELVKDYFNIEKVWVDEENLFSVQYLSVK